MAIVASILSFKETSKAGKASRAAAQTRAEITKLENARERRNQIREARIARGQAIAQAAASGGGGGGFGGIFSSGAQGEQVSLFTQLKSNLRFLETAGELNVQASNLEIRAARSQTRASIFSGISQTLFQAASLG